MIGWLLDNPILAREVAHRMRDSRTYFVPMVYVIVLSLVVYGAYAVATGFNEATDVQGWQIGMAIFHAVAITQMLLVVFLVPSVSAAAITAERERGNLVPLLATPLSRFKLVLGKLIAPLLYILLLVSTSLPFAGLSFGFGGTDLALLAETYGHLISTALFLAALGLWISSIMRRTVPAVLLAYGLVVFLLVGPSIGDMIIMVAMQEQTGPWFGYLNPFHPLIANIQFGVNEFEGDYQTWITPLLQVGLASLLFAHAALRCRKMRD